jgi:hypothetical protein
VKKRFNDDERRRIGIACLDGRTVASIADEWNCGRDLTVRCMSEVVTSLPNYTSQQWIEIIIEPGCGLIKSWRILYKKLTAQTSEENENERT